MPKQGGMAGEAGHRLDLSARLDEWRRLLLDTSKRSRLISSKFGRGGVLAVEHPDFFQLWKHLAVDAQTLEFPWPSQWIDVDGLDEPDAKDDGQERAVKGVLSRPQLQSIRESPTLETNALLTNLPDRPLDGRLKRLAIAASTSLSEQGVNSLFLAFGFLRWFESADSETPILSPLVLMPVSLHKVSADSTWKIAPIDDDLSPNHPLAEMLRSEFRLELPLFPEDQLWESSELLRSFLEEIKQAVVAHERWQVEFTAGLGTFAFQKVSMWRDLLKNEAQIINHPLCRGIAGDSSLMPTTDAADILRSDLDQAVPPETSYLVRDCDGSQLAAMEVVQQGHHLIMDGPPGTGKSQTITNIIARCLANNKTVLFVSEKAAALEVVKRRLDEAKLGDFCLECHSHKANKRAVVEELGRSLNRETEIYPSQDQKVTELRRTRQRLNDYVRALHVKRSALELTVYSVHGRLARIRTSSATRVPIANIHLFDRNRLQEMEEAVARLAACGGIIAAKGIHPWRGSRSKLYSLTLPDDIRFHFARAGDGLRKLIEVASPLETWGFVSASATRADISMATDFAARILQYPRIPSSWVEAGLLRTAERYIALNELSENHRILWTSVSAYSSDAHLKADLAAVKATVARANELTATVPALPASIRQRILYLEQADIRLHNVVDAADRLETATMQLRNVLGIKNTSISSAFEASDLARSGLSVAGLEQAKAPWFEPGERRRLRQIAADAKQISAMALATRSPMESKFLSPAFATIACEQIDEILRHKSWLRRLGSSWRRAKQNLCPLYSDRIPSNAREIVEDAFQLSRFHRYVSQLRSTADPDRDTLGWDSALDFNWDSLVASLDTIDHLPDALQSSEGIRSVATSPDSQIRATVISAANQVQDTFAKLSVALAQVAEITKSPTALGDNPLHASPATLKARAQELQTSCQEHAEQLKAILPLIEHGKDVSFEGLMHDFDVLTELRALTDQAEEITSAMGEKLPDPDSKSLGDWTECAGLAQWVVAFVKQHAGAPPSHVVRAISDAAVGAELSAAVEKIRSTDEPALREGLRLVESLFSQTDTVSTGLVLSQSPVSVLLDWMLARVRDADRISEWVSYENACNNLSRVGLSALRDEVLDEHVRPDEAVDVLRQRFYRLWLDEAYRTEPALGEFDLTQHDHTVSRFREVDRFWVKNGFAQVRSRILANTARVSGVDEQAPDNSELGILLREVHKKRRHLPLRRLFGSMPSLLLKIKPCVMMSPLAVSTYFDAGDIRFDVVIFDEASQVRPHDAICAIYRGSQLVVAGDQKQLPPTNFFERLGNEENEDEDDELQPSSSDYESILDMCATLRLPRQRLKWHYRSKRESLIAFSNQHFYGGELVTFPSVRDVDGSSGVTFFFVENGRWAGGAAGGVNQAEAERIADMVIRHAAECPEKSLGVITMNQAQQMHVMELIENRRRSSLHLEQFFSNDKADPFFVKNLENVQGDERDVIFLGVGYAKNDVGTLSHNFGPLNRQGGERRLNVAVTRAREALTLFTSIRADDIDLSRTQSRGAKLLRAYLDFAERGKVALAGAETEDGEHDFDSDFESEVARALTDHGLNVHRQIGCSGFRIDLALVHPAHPGRYVLGVECDGATYHSSATARDRDRLRQDILESLGWRICRIWSTDWIRDPRRQIQKVLEAFQNALDASTVNHSIPAHITEVETLEPVKSAVRPAPDGGSTALRFSNIDEVPTDVLRQVLSDAIASFGAMPLDDLTQAAARKLGFQRTGSRIRERVSEEVQNLKRRGELVVGSDGRLRSQNGKPDT
jgi:very-short-patch-repair endonuclease